MDCESRKDQLLQYALGALDAPEQQELRAHLQTGCPRCQGRLSEVQSMLALLPLALPQAPVPAGAKARLLERISAAEAPMLRLPRTEPGATKQPARRSSFIWPMLIGGAIAASVASLLFFNTFQTMQGKVRSLTDRLEGKNDELREVKEQLKAANHLNQLVSSPKVMVCDLKPMDVQPTATARLIWDPQTRTIRLYAADLKSLPPNRAYELWLINKNHEPHAAGTFQVDAAGSGTVAMTMPDDPGSIVATAVSVEQWNDGKGVLVPTMAQVQMQGNVH